jgi:hypothetical protein
MPTGWSVDNSPQDTGAAPGCLKGLDNRTSEDARVTARFNGNANGIPSIQENLAHFPSGGSTALARYNAVITACKTISFTSGGQTFTGTIGAMSFPQIGDESHAYQVSFTVKGITLALDVIVARRGDTAMSLIYEDVGSPDLTQVQQFATTAIGKVTTG